MSPEQMQSVEWVGTEKKKKKILISSKNVSAEMFVVVVRLLAQESRIFWFWRICRSVGNLAMPFLRGNIFSLTSTNKIFSFFVDFSASPCWKNGTKINDYTKS